MTCNFKLKLSRNFRARKFTHELFSIHTNYPKTWKTTTQSQLITTLGQYTLSLLSSKEVWRNFNSCLTPNQSKSLSPTSTPDSKCYTMKIKQMTTISKSNSLKKAPSSGTKSNPKSKAHSQLATYDSPFPESQRTNSAAFSASALKNTSLSR